MMKISNEIKNCKWHRKFAFLPRKANGKRIWWEPYWIMYVGTFTSPLAGHLYYTEGDPTRLYFIKTRDEPIIMEWKGWAPIDNMQETARQLVDEAEVMWLAQMADRGL